MVMDDIIRRVTEGQENYVPKIIVCAGNDVYGIREKASQRKYSEVLLQCVNILE
jgi:hypothetical protein